MQGKHESRPDPDRLPPRSLTRNITQTKHESRPDPDRSDRLPKEENMKNSPAPEIAPLLMLVLMMAIQAFGQENLTKPNDLLDQRITMQMEKQPLGLVFRNLIEN